MWSSKLKLINEYFISERKKKFHENLRQDEQFLEQERQRKKRKYNEQKTILVSSAN
jgi:hypothetical protein